MLRSALGLAKIGQNVAMKQTLRNNSDCARHLLLSTYPRVRIPFAEKMALVMVIMVGTLSPALYIAMHLKDYRESKN